MPSAQSGFVSGVAGWLSHGTVVGGVGSRVGRGVAVGSRGNVVIAGAVTMLEGRTVVDDTSGTSMVVEMALDCITTVDSVLLAMDVLPAGAVSPLPASGSLRHSQRRQSSSQISTQTSVRGSHWHTTRVGHLVGSTVVGEGCGDSIHPVVIAVVAVEISPLVAGVIVDMEENDVGEKEFDTGAAVVIAGAVVDCLLQEQPGQSLTNITVLTEPGLQLQLTSKHTA